MIKIVFFDMDGTLVDEDSSWRAVHRFLGTDVKAAKALERFSRGEMNYEEFVEHDVGLWPKMLRRSFFEHVFSKVYIRQEAKTVFRRLKEKSVIRVIVTSGLNLLAERVSKELDADEYVSNEMIFDPQGFFTGDVKINVDPSSKGEVIGQLCDKYFIPFSEAAAVGDAVYDRSMFRAVNVSILYVKPGKRNQEPDLAKHVVESLEDILQLIP
ncbi:MAG: HAD-IB family phosphatase [Thermoproteota archaeon]